MTQAITADDVMEVTVEGTNETTPWAWVRHYIATTVATTVGWENALLDYFAATILAALDDCTTSDCKIECISLGRVAPKPRNVTFQAYDPISVGDITSDGVPNGSAVLIRLNTDEVGARNRGRCYMVGCAESHTDGGILNADGKVAWDIFAATLDNVITASGNVCTPCVFSRTAYNPDAEEAQPVGDYTSIITSAVVQGNLASQRRRRRKRSTFAEAP